MSAPSPTTIPSGAGGVARANVRFLSAGEWCAGWLYPSPEPGPAAAIVMAHGFGGTKELRLDAYAERFQAAGMAVLVFDYRHLGGSEGEPRQLVDVRRQLRDWRSALEWMRSVPGVDRSRLAIWGTSFAGGHVIEIAAHDPGVCAVVSQVPYTSGPATMATMGPARLARMTVAGMRDGWRAVRGAEPHRVPIVGPPGSTGAMTSEDAEPGFRALVPPSFHWPDQVAARVMLTLGGYSPGRAARRVRCPLLVQAAADDAVTPAAPARRAGLRSPLGELIEYPIGHFDVYIGEHFERAVADQIAFLERHLLQ